MYGCENRLTPTIMLKGKWLSDFGLDVGSYISITCEDGMLIIAPDIEKMELEEAMAEQKTVYGQCDNRERGIPVLLRTFRKENS